MADGRRRAGGDPGSGGGGAVPHELRFTVLLGGTPTPTKDRWGTAILVQSATTTVMLDAGPGVTRRLVEAGHGPTEVDAVVFTHHHFDHNAGFPGLFLSRWDQCAGQCDDLLVAGPPPTSRFVDRLFAPEDGAFWPDLNARMEARPSHAVYVNRGGVLPRLPPDPEVREIHPGDSFSIGDIEFSSGLAQHVQPYLDSNAYRITVGGSSFVYTGDTEPCPEIVELASGCDALISMCWDLQETMEANGESTGQTGTRGAAAMAEEARVRSLILTHVGPAISSGLPADEETLLRERYGGPIHLAHELDAFGLSSGPAVPLER